jgi:hypothetical protein
MSGSELTHAIPAATTIDEEAARAAALTICDPARGLTHFQASEVLKALGLMNDPLHKELTPKGNK